MTTDLLRIIDDAMQLDPNARAVIAETLLESLDIGPDFEVSEAWLAEVHRRGTEIEGGAVTLIPGDQALGEHRAKYGS